MKINEFLYWVGGRLVEVYTKIMLQMSVISHFQISKGPKIIVANHPTGTDPFVLFSLLKHKASILISENSFKVPVFGRYIKYIGHIPVSKKKGYIAFTKALKLLKDKGTVVIFIEGDFSPSVNKFLKPRTGAVRLALSTGAQIIPIGISVRKENVMNIHAAISGSETFGKWYFQGPYAVTIGKGVRMAGNVEDRALVRRLTKNIMEKVRKLSKESSMRICT